MNYISSLNHSLINKYGPRESIEYDVIIVEVAHQGFLRQSGLNN